MHFSDMPSQAMDTFEFFSAGFAWESVRVTVLCLRHLDHAFDLRRLSGLAGGVLVVLVSESSPSVFKSISTSKS